MLQQHDVTPVIASIAADAKQHLFSPLKNIAVPTSARKSSVFSRGLMELNALDRPDRL